MSIAVVYHSGYGSTKTIAEHIVMGAKRELEDVSCLSVLDAQDNFYSLHKADVIVFGSPTYLGNISAEFKRFMEVTGRFSHQQLWKNKLAAGFTSSSASNGDKLNTLISLSLFAAQHSMIWISAGLLSNENYPIGGKCLLKATDCLGFTADSIAEDKQTNSKVIEEAQFFGQRIANVTKQFISHKNKY